MVGKRILNVRKLVEKGEVVALHVGAIIVGFVMMVVGLAMGVTMVLLPVGIVIGFAGVLVFVWGFLGYSDQDPQT
jgi:hypothetical protein